MIDRHAEPPSSTRSVFPEEAAQVRSVVATFYPGFRIRTLVFVCLISELSLYCLACVHLFFRCV